ncbi:protease adaptor protein RcdA [Cucumibacter marinus]|uniref:protease adaptor protein RcdA n=1 Tax=Cucumibacter marinus TaxID=1121252 RepID=UPI0003F7981A|nr:DUF1465 family protein [Cucumibacter marinus]
MSEQDRQTDMVSLGRRFVASEGFDRLYNEGMALVEEVAAYLDGDGRTESRELDRDVSVVYATESMRLTTRLMQLASWLLLQRAVKEGELTPEQARSEKHRVTFRPAPPAERPANWTQLPETMLDLIARGDTMYDRIVKLERMDRAEVPEPNTGENAVANQLDRLRAAFGQG